MTTSDGRIKLGILQYHWICQSAATSEI